jgi:hypothetical protein
LPEVSASTDNAKGDRLTAFRIKVRHQFDDLHPSDIFPAIFQPERTVALGDRFWQMDVLNTWSISRESYQRKILEFKFRGLAQQWQQETALLSRLDQKVLHPAYQQIIGIGAEVLPLIFLELEQQPNHWFWALKAITGANPIKPEHRGRVKLMAQDWLKWGRDHGYEW